MTRGTADRHFGATSDFSPVAARYDATRETPAALLETCWRRLIDLGVLPRHGLVVDAGCGTGQISLPLAALGLDVLGFDVSREMAAIARSKCPPGSPARYAVADVRGLPLPDAAADGVVAARLLQHVDRWENACGEMLRILGPGACVVHLFERRPSGNPVRRQFRACARTLGFAERHLGLRHSTALAPFHHRLGCAGVAVDMSDLRWTRRVIFSQALEELRERLYGEFWYLPQEVYRRCLAHAARWVDHRRHRRETEAGMEAFLEVQVFRKP